ncbi:hypothetical protein [Rhizobium sp. YTU87027]|uniref:hypothetical protein n=1 Tax=Rhizobium sp. YTU87027 TaxID=3417741 RepID=UPI003D68568E
MTADQDLTPIASSHEPTGGAKKQESDTMHHGLEKALGGKSVPASGDTGTSDNGNKKDGSGGAGDTGTRE